MRPLAFHTVPFEAGEKGQHLSLFSVGDPDLVQCGRRMLHEPVVVSFADSKPLMGELHRAAGVQDRPPRMRGDEVDGQLSDLSLGIGTHAFEPGCSSPGTEPPCEKETPSPPRSSFTRA